MKSPLIQRGSSFVGVVRGLSSEGYGVVAHPEGPVFFVRGTWPGDEGSFRVQRLEKRYGYAELVSLLQPSPDRVNPPCEHSGLQEGSCGGCAWMLASYESQLVQKEQRVRYALEQAKLMSDSLVMQPIMGSSQELGYRNRAQFKTDGKTRLGFVSEKSHVLADIKDCLVLTPPMRRLLAEARAQLPNPEWVPEGSAHEWSFLDLDEGVSSLAETKPNVRRPFRQGNTAQNQQMKAWVQAHVLRLRASCGLGEDSAVELFAGSGNFTELFVESGWSKIQTFEVSREAVAELQERRLPGVDAKVLDLSKIHGFHSLAKSCVDAKVLLFDPPRAGCEGIEKLVVGLPKLQEVLSVSCDVATWARDAVRIVRSGFSLVEVQPVDLFPQTPHVEVLSRFVRV